MAVAEEYHRGHDFTKHLGSCCYDAAFRRQLVVYLGGDPSLIKGDWTWAEFGEQYPELIEPAFELFRTAQEGDPAYGIYALACWCGLDLKRALDALQKVEVGNPAWEIFLLALDGMLGAEMALSAIRKVKVGDPAWAIYLLARYYGLDVERALEAIRQIGVGDPAGAIYRLVLFCGLDVDRAIEALGEMPRGEKYIGWLLLEVDPREVGND